MDINESLDGSLANPHKERNWRSVDIFVDPSGNFEVRFLQDVCRIDSASEEGSDSEGDDTFQFFLVDCKQVRQGFLAALNQKGSFIGIRGILQIVHSINRYL